ncbi:hypothetical protein [Magnetospirillum molischianum]|nr:hypothetical protein [Magnetospirillum molischianum]
MADLSAADAIKRAGVELGVEAAVPAEAIRTRRLDRIDGGYFLVVFNNSGGNAIAVATIEVESGAPGVTATLPGTAPFPPVSAQTALDLAAAGAGARAEAVWTPCRASMSPLYILWEITGDGRVVYVDQQSRVHDSLLTGGRGGGPGESPIVTE